MTIVRVDLHCHSSASQESRLGVQRALGLPECATPPEEVYALAKRRGMDFVTITDHDTIAGVLEIADRPDVFVSEELTARFRGEPQAVHVLCWGITQDDHEWLQRNSGDVEACAEYLHGNSIACALAHPFYAVAAPLEARHRRRLARLFPVWETRNGSRAPELNLPAAVYIETHGGAGVGGSDDHAGVDVGRTWTETPPASTPEELLRRLRRGEATARGDQGSAAKWAHAAMALGGAGADQERGSLRRPEPPGGVQHGRARPEPGRRPRRTARRGPRPGGRPRAAPRVARLARPPDVRERAARLDAGRRLQPRGAVPAGPAAARAPAARSGGGDRERGAGAARTRPGPSARRLPARSRRSPIASPRSPRASSPPASPRSPTRVGRLPRAREGQARRARRRAAPGRPGGGRRRRDARRDPHARPDPREGRARLRGRGDRHRPERRPAPSRGRGGRDPLLRRPARGRAQPAGDGRGARRGPLRPRAPLLPRPRRGRGLTHRPDHGASARGLLPHGARRLRRPPLRRPAAAGGHGRDAGRLLRPVLRRALAERPCGRVAARAGRALSPDRAVGPRRRHVALRPGAARAARPSRGAHGALRGTPDEGEGRGPPRRRLPARARARPAAAARAGGRRPRGGARCASGWASARRSSAGSRARPFRARTRARTSSCSRAAPTRSAR